MHLSSSSPFFLLPTSAFIDFPYSFILPFQENYLATLSTYSVFPVFFLNPVHVFSTLLISNAILSHHFLIYLLSLCWAILVQTINMHFYHLTFKQKSKSHPDFWFSSHLFSLCGIVIFVGRLFVNFSLSKMYQQPWITIFIALQRQTRSYKLSFSYGI